MFVVGVCVVIVVLSCLGIVLDCFCFEGFLFVKIKLCCDKLEVLSEEYCILIFYELIYCILDMFVDM